MIIINLQNVEEIIFFNKAVQQILPEFKNTFQTWALGKRFFKVSHLCQKAIFEFFDTIEESHIKKLETFFESAIKIVKTDPHLVKNHSFSINEEILFDDLYENWFIWRSADKLYICSWR